MKLIVVDNNDVEIGFKEREDLDSKDIYRVSVLWLVNKKGEILLAQRALNKKKDPGMWGPGVAGTVEKGESYHSNIIKEAEEELGLKNIKVKEFFKSRIKKPHNHFTKWFLLKVEGRKEFDFNDEVEKVKWFTKKELLNTIEKNPENFVYSMRDVIEEVLAVEG
ncbi:NUDIX domain-containing protein [archaeon]|jgi:isopentenyl-diphosphate Delta-isomerase|nr:NUDIX domain-containing protein [archaeon]MBT4241775.1 NUDIX domain-containing protein [archaeon]MBT4418323.1 NUDIX domain-containing protein [archaeon]